MGYPISDSFAVVYPHDSLGDRSVIIGDVLEHGEYSAKGNQVVGGLYAFLPSYNDDTIHYDVNSPPVGYDIGDGVLILHPTYKSGFAIQVGSDAYISATGTLVDSEHRQAGRSWPGDSWSAMDDAKAVPAPLLHQFLPDGSPPRGLKPATRYRVTLNTSTPISFTFTTPKKGAGALLDLKTVALDLTRGLSNETANVLRRTAHLGLARYGGGRRGRQGRERSARARPSASPP